MPNSIPIAPKQHNTPVTPSSGGTSTSSGTHSPAASAGGHGSGSGGHGSGGRSSDPYAAAQARADAKERKANRKASRKYLDQAAALDLQAQALTKALSKHGFLAALEEKLANIGLVSRQQDRMLLGEYRTRLEDLQGAASDNEKSAAQQNYANVANRGRERMNAISEAMANGAGESDVLRAQQMALRNFGANQQEVTRAYHDTLRSVNSSLTDLVSDTRKGRANVANQANADREQLWTSYYDQRGEAFTQLGNVRGQQAEYYGMANEALGSKHTRRQRRHAVRASGHAFDRAADMTGQAYDNPGIPKDLRQWEGAPDFSAALNGSGSIGGATTIQPTKPEGAGLRKWG